jgi:ribosomal protein L11 methyltransferase
MWRQWTVTVEESLADPVANAFTAQGALSVSFEDGGDQPLFEPKPGETPIWQQTKVTALFAWEIDPQAVRQGLEKRFAKRLSAWEYSELEDQVWERAWLDHFRPTKFGQRLWICPTGFECPEPEAVHILLDPGLAFGTGTHPTTALCLEWLDRLPLEGQTVIDYGCGSGILAVAALKLGAARAIGIDIDPQAITASAENARKNDVATRLNLFTPEALTHQSLRADVLVANILASPLIELASRICENLLLGGRIALSGLLSEQGKAVQRAYEPWIEFDPPRDREDWILLSGIKVRE